MKKEKQDELLLDHLYDGIQELDNPLPRWWVWLFLITFVFGLGYFIYYIPGPGKSPLAEFNGLQQQQANQKQNNLNITALTASLKDTKALAAGQQIFIGKCSPCHGTQGQGIIGPNLTDEYWIHGQGAPEDVFKVILDGVPEKGMVSWGKTLSPQDLAAVTAYVISLKGTTPPNPKAPQGNKSS